MKSAKEQIMDLLPQLSPMDRAEIRGALSGISKEVGQAEMHPDLLTDWVLLGIINYLTGRGELTSQFAAYELQRRKAFSSYQRKLPEVRSYLERLERQAITKTRHRPKLALLAARALAELLEARNIFSVNAMLSQIDKVPEAIERAYPGYASAGLFSFIINQVGDE